VRTGVIAAVKDVNLDRVKLNQKHRDSLDQECRVLRSLSGSANVVALLDVERVRCIADTCVQAQTSSQTENRLFLMLEHCDAGDLSDWLRSHGPLVEADAAHFLRHIASGLSSLRDIHIIHRDLKPSNLLLLSSGGRLPTLKIADFGFARPLEEAMLADSICGSPLYMAPECLACNTYDASADLWATGVILYEMLVGRCPFSGANHVQLMRNIDKVEGASLPSDVRASPRCRRLVHKLLRRNPADRIPFEAFFSDPFVSGAAVAADEERMPGAASPVSSRASVSHDEDSGFILVGSPSREAMAAEERALAGMSLRSQARSFFGRRLFPLFLEGSGLSSSGGGGSGGSALFGSTPSRASPSTPPASPLWGTQSAAMTVRSGAGSAAAGRGGGGGGGGDSVASASARLQLCAAVLDMLADERERDARELAPDASLLLQAEALSLMLLSLSCVRAARATAPHDGARLERLASGGESIRARARALGQRMATSAASAEDAASPETIHIPTPWPIVRRECLALARAGALGGGHPAAALTSLRQALALLFLLLQDASLLPAGALHTGPQLKPNVRIALQALSIDLRERARRSRAAAGVRV